MEVSAFTISSVIILHQMLQGVCCFVNIAINKTADMSSSQYSSKCLADEAVDGDVSQKVAQGSCAMTSDNFHKQAWWRVDLGDIYVLNSINIYYRKESENPKESLTYWLSGFSVYVADTLNWWIGTRCYLHNNGQHTVPGPSDILTVLCNATGRYVTVYKQRNGSCVWSPHPDHNKFCAKLDLCEVQVLGCEDGTYGRTCSISCSGNCLNGAHCNKAHGGCDGGCAPGYTGFYCNDVCPPGMYGNNCKHRCSEKCIDITKCRKIDGYCEKCFEGWMGNLCNKECSKGSFGLGCSSSCGHCIDGDCFHTNGSCPLGCSPGWKGFYCNETCNHGFHGYQCSPMCESCTETCHHVTGKCLVYEDHKDSIIIAVSVTSTIIITILVVALLITCVRRGHESKQHMRNSFTSNTVQHGPVQMSNLNGDTPDTQNARNRVTYDDLLSTISDSNTYESLQRGRTAIYTNTDLG